MSAAKDCGHGCCRITTNRYHAHVWQPAWCPYCALHERRIEGIDVDHEWFNHLITEARARARGGD